MAVFRVEKTRDFTVMSNHHLRNRNLSLKAKGLLSLMLSLPEDWDYTLAGLAHICKDGLSSIRAGISELESHGYLCRKRLRNEKGQLTDTEYTILEKPVEPERPPVSIPGPDTPPPPICENRTQAFEPICDYPILGNPTQEKPMLENRTQLIYAKESSTDKANTYPINPAPMDGMDGMVDVYRNFIMENIEYDLLCERYGFERLDEVVALMLDCILSRRERIRIAGDDFPREAVKSRMLKLDSSHVEYVFGCLDKNTTEVRNIKAYLLAALYNAPATIDSFYRAQVNHDLGGA